MGRRSRRTRHLTVVTVVAAGLALTSAACELPMSAAPAPAPPLDATATAAAPDGDLGVTGAVPVAYSEPQHAQGPSNPAAAFDEAAVAEQRDPEHQDVLVTVESTDQGLAVFASDGNKGWAPRQVALIHPGGYDARGWTGNVCVTGTGRYAAVVLGPDEATNNPAALDRGGAAYSIDLRDGIVRPLVNGMTLYYHSPGCGTDDTAVFVRYLGVDQEHTELYRAELASGQVTRVASVDGQVTSPVPAGNGRVVAARGNELVQVGGDRVESIEKTAGAAFDLRPTDDGNVDYALALEGDRRTEIHHLDVPAKRSRKVAGGPLGTTKLETGRRGHNNVIGATDRDDPDAVRFVDGDGSSLQAVSLDGGAIVTDESGDEARHDDHDHDGDHAEGHDDGHDTAADAHAGNLGRVRDGHGGRAIVDLRHDDEAEVTASVEMPPMADEVPVQAQPGPKPASYTPGDGATVHPAAVTTPSVLAANTTTPTCAVPRNDTTRQVLQPNATQVWWAVQQASAGNLTSANFTRPGNYELSGLGPFSPNNDFPKPPLAGNAGKNVPPALAAAVFTQESANYQASRRALPGISGNPEIGNYYGDDLQNNNPLTRIDYGSSDCGYGISQVTTWMRTTLVDDTAHGGPWTTAKQTAVGIDYTENVAAGIWALGQKWNELYNAGMLIRHGGAGDGDANDPINWYFALWAYNTGLTPQSAGNPWGLGWTNNPRNGDYAPDRANFLCRPVNGNQLNCDGESWRDDQLRKNWPYQERVFGFMFNPIFTITKWDKPKDPTTGAPTQFRRPDSNLWCTSANSCDPTYLAGTANGYCTRADRLCRWNQSVTFPTTPATYPGATGYSAEPAWDNPHPPNCELDPTGPPQYDPPSNAVIVDDIPNKATIRSGCNNSNWTAQGSFRVVYGADGAGVPIGQIDWHQLGVGWGGHIWFTKNRKDWNDSKHINRGIWTPPNLTGNYDVQVHIPDNGASTEHAEYKVFTSATDIDPYTIFVNQHRHQNNWISLGTFALQAGARVELSNLTGEETYAHNVAYDAVAFAPSTDPPLPVYLKVTDSALGTNTNVIDAGDPVNPATGNFHDTEVDTLFPASAGVWGLGIARTVNSSGQLAGDFGYRWANSFGERIRNVDTNRTELMLGDGRIVDFILTGTTWNRPPSFDGNLDMTGANPVVRFPSGEVWTFVNGRLSTKANGQGQTVTVTRTSAGTLDTVTSSTGYGLKFTDNNLDGYIDQVSTQGTSVGNTRKVGYTYQSLLTTGQVIDAGDDHVAAGSVWAKTLRTSTEPFLATTDPTGLTTYDVQASDGRLTAIRVSGLNYSPAVDPVTLITNTYRADGRVDVQTSQDGDTTRFAYDDVNRKVTVTNVTSGDVTVYGYDGNGLPSQVVDANTNSLTQERDARGRVTREVDRAGVETRYFYDSWDRVVQTAGSDPRNGQPDAIPVPDPTTGWINAPKGGWSFERTTYRPDVNGAPDLRVDTKTDATGAVTKFDYEGANLQPSVVTKGFGSANPVEARTKVVNGRTMAERDGDGITTCNYYDAKGFMTGSGQLLVATTTTDFADKCAANENTAGALAKTTFTADELGQTTSMTPADLAGTTKKFVYTYWGTGRARAATDALGFVTETAYDPLGRVWKTTEQAGAAATPSVTATYTYKPAETTDCGVAGSRCSKVIKVEPYNGVTTKTTTSVYDANGDLREDRRPGGATTVYTYGKLARLTSAVDPDGRASTYNYDAEGRMVDAVNGNNPAIVEASRHVDYDRLGRASRITEPRSGSATTGVRPQTLVAYDKAGRQTQQAGSDPSTGFLPAEWASPQTDACHRFKDGRIPVPGITSTDTSDGNASVNCTGKAYTLTTTTFLPNGLPQAQAVTRNDAPHASGTQATVEGTYSAGGRLTCVKTMTAEAVGATAARYRYDAAEYDPLTGNMVRKRGQIGAASACSDAPTDATKWATTAYGYRPSGTISWKQEPEQYKAHPAVDGTHANWRTSYGYDDVGRTIAIKTPDPAHPGTAAVTRRTCYDLSGNAVASVDAIGKSTWLEYYPDHTVKRAIDANGTTASSDPCKPNLVGGHRGETTFTYDQRGNLTARQSWTEDTGGAITVAANEQWQYSLGDEQTLYTSPLGKTTTIAYQLLGGRLTKRAKLTGNTTDATDPSGSSRRNTVVSMSESGQPYQAQALHLSTANVAISADTLTYDLTYDRLGRLSASTATTTVGATTERLEYDAANELTKVTHTDGKTTAYEWDVAGGRTKMTAPSAKAYAYRYDAGHRLAGVDLSVSGVWVPQVNYTHNADGDTTREDLAGGTGAGFRQWDRDAATGLFNRYRQTVGSLSTQTTVAYDVNGRIAKDCAVTSTTAGAPCASTDRATSYGYDNAGQLLTAATANDAGAGATTTRTFTYGNRGDRRSQVTSTSSGSTTITSRSDADGELVSSGTTQYTYDQAGRRRTAAVQGGTTTTYGYDAVGRLRTTNAGAMTDTRTYDPFGNYASASNVNAPVTTTSTYYWDLAGGVPTVSDMVVNGTTSSVLAGEGRVQQGGANIAFDYLGSPIRTDGTAPKEFGAFGEPRGGTAPNRSFGYRDELTVEGLTSLRNREYDTATGTFLTRDPLDGVVSTPTVTNPFHYADNDPLDKVDPMGLRPEDDEDSAAIDTWLAAPDLANGVNGIGPSGSSSFFSIFKTWHDAVADDLRDLTQPDSYTEYEFIPGTTERPCFIPEGGKKKGMGRADVCNTRFNEIWEVKYFGINGELNADAQLERYRAADPRRIRGRYVGPSIAHSSMGDVISFSTLPGVRLYTPMRWRFAKAYAGARAAQLAVVAAALGLSMTDPNAGGDGIDWGTVGKVGGVVVGVVAVVGVIACVIAEPCGLAVGGAAAGAGAAGAASAPLVLQGAR